MTHNSPARVAWAQCHRLHRGRPGVTQHLSLVVASHSLALFARKRRLPLKVKSYFTVPETT